MGEDRRSSPIHFTSKRSKTTAISGAVQSLSVAQGILAP